MTVENWTDCAINLLKYGLQKKGVSRDAYTICRNGEQCKPQGLDDFCLQENEDGSWTIFYIERGRWNKIAIFFGTFDAVEFFYKKLVKDSDLFSLREEWERDTGLEFSFF